MEPAGWRGIPHHLFNSGARKILCCVSFQIGWESNVCRCFLFKIRPILLSTVVNASRKVRILFAVNKLYTHSKRWNVKNVGTRARILEWQHNLPRIAAKQMPVPPVRISHCVLSEAKPHSGLPTVSDLAGLQPQ
jgi:hypothetical protein